MRFPFLLILLALTLFLLPLHSLITAELVLTITLLIFYTYQFVSFSNLKNRGVAVAFLLTIFLFLVTIFSIQRPINFYELYRWFLIIWSIPFLKYCIKKYGAGKIIFVSLIILAIHATWGVTQFIFQHSLGLHSLGESFISSVEPGVAKFLFNNQKIIRAYGPYTHANVLAASLILGLVLLMSELWNKNKKSIIFFGTIFVLGILVAFSRIAFLNLLLIFLFLFFTKRKIFLEKNIRILFFISVIITLLFSPLLFYRATDPEDRAISERQSGSGWALEIISEKVPWTGYGIGTYQTVLKEYLEKKDIDYNSWELQPVHSVPLLMIIEWGIVATGIFFIVGIYFISSSIKQKNGDALMLVCVSIPFLLFDHYLFTQTAPLVWLLVSGLLLAEEL